MQESVSFDRAASFYDDTRGFPPDVAPRVAAAITEAGALTENARVLEIGVGTGRITLPVAVASGASMYGVDLSVPMLNVLQSKQADERVHVLRGDAIQLPLPDATFDAVIAAHIFHLVSDPHAALGEIGRVLASGGTLLYTHVDYSDNPKTAVFYRRRGGKKRGRFWDADWLGDAGWIPARDPVRTNYETTQTAVDYIDSLRNRIWSSTWSQTDEEIETHIQEIESAFAKLGIPLDKPLTRQLTFTASAYRPA